MPESKLRSFGIGLVRRARDAKEIGIQEDYHYVQRTERETSAQHTGVDG